MGYTREDLEILFGWEHQREELRPVTQGFYNSAMEILERYDNFRDNLPASAPAPVLIGKRTTIAINELLDAMDEAVRALAFIGIEQAASDK